MRVNLVPDIAAALAAETNAKTRQSIEFDLRMLRDGYWVRPESPGWVIITARTQRGTASKSLKENELQSKGLGLILAELRGEAKGHSPTPVR